MQGLENVPRKSRQHLIRSDLGFLPSADRRNGTCSVVLVYGTGVFLLAVYLLGYECLIPVIAIPSPGSIYPFTIFRANSSGKWSTFLLRHSTTLLFNQEKSLCILKDVWHSSSLLLVNNRLDVDVSSGWSKRKSAPWCLGMLQVRCLHVDSFCHIEVQNGTSEPPRIWLAWAPGKNLIVFTTSLF